MRGNHYVSIGRVRIVRGTADDVDAIVTGSVEYQVQLKRSGHDHVVLDATCECAYFVDQHNPCKHVWGTLRLAERRSLLTGTTGIEAVTAELRMPDDIASDEDWEAEPPSSPSMRHGQHVRPSAARWDAASALVNELKVASTTPATEPPFAFDGGELLYMFDVPSTLTAQGQLAVEVMWRKRKKDGAWGLPRPAKVAATDLHRFADEDRDVLSRLLGASMTPTWAVYTANLGTSWFALPKALATPMTQLIASTGRAFVRTGPGEHPSPIDWEDDVWVFRPAIETHDGNIRVDAVFERQGEQMPLDVPVLVLALGLLFTRDTVAPLLYSCDFLLIASLRRSGPVEVPPAKQAGLAEGLARAGVQAESLPDALRVSVIDVTPRPRLSLRRSPLAPARLRADLSFDYAGFVQPAGGTRVVFDPEHRQMITRATGVETAAQARLSKAGFAPYSDYMSRSTVWEVSAHQLVPIVRALTAEGWHVSAEGRVYQSPGRINMSVTSGIDWFDLTATVEFGTETLPLGDVLSALRRREVMVRLGDGTVGLLPDEWLRRYGPLAATGEATADGLRFKPSQAALLDVLLSAQEAHAAISIDERFTQAREALARFDKVEPADPPASFTGTLRTYQREGLGWLKFLRTFGFGGCLADDMGLGKTIMVLALLEWRRTDPTVADTDRRPSLVVVPRSLIHNWHAEAAKFAPGLRVVDYSGADRTANTLSLADCDVVLATYGTLRQDIAHLKDAEFEYVILDEAQTIKNAATAASKAVRLLRGRHRLALSGTPIENHLGELWSLFDFLNPGLLGSSSLFGGSVRPLAPDPETLTVMARGLRPFILRRTKEQVAKDLPPRTEQTILCELEPKQRAYYNGVRAHYQQSVLSRVDSSGLAKSKMHILEALLRLRQAACHPGLIDAERESDASAKLDMLVPRLAEIAESGHKALVFSQFTSFLALLRPRLDALGLTYEYLDGRTRDRRTHVDRFQTDPACPIFLISLKAGGVGLNLTAAGYVFLLDPWWNPAVEAQAIDRAHRIGQLREVFAYRLIAKGTIEEKVLELQRSKRELADAILRADGGGIRGITRDDVEMLLG